MRPKIKKGARITGDARTVLAADIIYSYVKLLKTIRQIAADTGRSYGAVHAILRQAEMLRTKGGKPREAMP